MADNLLKTPVVTIVQPTVPTYRLRVFEALSRHPKPQFTILASSENGENLRILEGSELDQLRYKKVKMRLLRLGNNLLFTWQPEALRAVRREKPDCVVVHGGFLMLLLVFLYQESRP